MELMLKLCIALLFTMFHAKAEYLYGLCYLDFDTLTETLPIKATNDESFTMDDFGINWMHMTQSQSTDPTPLFCAWFNNYRSAKKMIKQESSISSDIMQNYQSSIQQDSVDSTMTVTCSKTSFHIETIKQIKSYHICWNDCNSENCQDLFDNTMEMISSNTKATQSKIGANSQETDTSESSESTSTSKTIILTIGFIMLGVCSILFVVALLIYLWTMYQRKKMQKNNKKRPASQTDEVIGTVLDEIAKYTIGDADGDEDMLFKDDWLNGDSSGSDGEILGEKILHAVNSNTKLPNLDAADSPKHTSTNVTDIDECAIPNQQLDKDGSQDAQ